jgi:hypothetical protein
MQNRKAGRKEILYAEVKDLECPQGLHLLQEEMQKRNAEERRVGIG